jgi:hypothetical protein
MNVFSLQQYHGWIFAYNATNGEKINVFSTTSTTRGDWDGEAAGAVWMGGGGIAVDRNGELRRLSASLSPLQHHTCQLIQTYRQTDIQTDQQVDGQTDGQTDRWPELWFYTELERQGGVEWVPAARASKERII